MDDLRRNLPGEEFDYPLLMSYLGDYAKPRDKVTRLLSRGDIVRVKKGLYVFGPSLRREPVCAEVLANLIYGPSYISLEYALSYYGLIPELVETVTSITTQKTKDFDTPVGHFSYRHLDQEQYTVGIDQLQADDHHYFLMASREKALADLVAQQSGMKEENDLYDYLTESLRIELEDLAQLDQGKLRKIAKAYDKTSVTLLLQLVEGL